MERAAAVLSSLLAACGVGLEIGRQKDKRWDLDRVFSGCTCSRSPESSLLLAFKGSKAVVNPCRS